MALRQSNGAPALLGDLVRVSPELMQLRHAHQSVSLDTMHGIAL